MTATVNDLLTERKHIALLGTVAALVAPAAAPAIASAAGKDKPAPRERLRADAPAAAIGDAVALDGPLLNPIDRLTPLIAKTTAVTEHRHQVEERKERKARAAKRKARREEEKFAHLPGGVSIGTLEAIAACESGGNPEAVSPEGTYRGKYQFDQGTWESVGGQGDPAAAPAAEQDYRAALLYSESGSSPWPICGQ
jgi:hypothetical protein